MKNTLAFLGLGVFLVAMTLSFFSRFAWLAPWVAGAYVVLGIITIAAPLIRGLPAPPPESPRQTPTKRWAMGLAITLFGANHWSNTPWLETLAFVLVGYAVFGDVWRDWRKPARAPHGQS